MGIGPTDGPRNHDRDDDDDDGQREREVAASKLMEWKKPLASSLARSLARLLVRDVRRKLP